ncbi:glycosyltransferase family 2 protein [Pannus brasiliensis CCIBt3594]|uniref:Glycosyltransferase family 2 protein n=1 Tax=Pannus brasiliensis CCIBt3594 TaxID=1427578 RepID=A0AAW9QNW7_9CHRO
MSTESLEGLPSFSIVLETENLANADIEGLSRSLHSLLEQDLSPKLAREVFLIESGDIPAPVLDRLREEFPWISVHPAPPDTGYYGAKMLGAKIATGEVIVYCDSDCVYEPRWLRALLTPFASDPEIQVVAGETSTGGAGIYGTAMALTYIFPQYSRENSIAPASGYFLNNVAFRRDFLLRYPIPDDLPLYRGNCVIHARELCRAGQTIWRQPIARAKHAPPNGFHHFFWRFLLIGNDYYWQKCLLQKYEKDSSPKREYKSDATPTANQMTGIFSSRIGGMFRNDPRHIFFFPLALPIVLSSAFLIFIGYWITAIAPEYLRAKYDEVL